MRIGKSFTFDSAHYIPGHNSCGNVHGHTWTLEVMVEGDISPLTGFLIDYHILGDVVRKVINIVDHRLINEELGGIHPLTCETLAQWFLNKIRISFNVEGRLGVRLQEGKGGWAEVWEE